MSDTTRMYLPWATAFGVIVALAAALWVFTTSQVSTRELPLDTGVGVCNHGIEPEVVVTENSIGKRLALSTGAAILTLPASTLIFLTLYKLLHFISSIATLITRTLTGKGTDRNTTPLPQNNTDTTNTPHDPIAKTRQNEFIFFHLKCLAMVALAAAMVVGGRAYLPTEKLVKNPDYLSRPTSDIPREKFLVEQLSTSDRLEAASASAIGAVVMTPFAYSIVLINYLLIRNLVSTTNNRRRRTRPPQKPSQDGTL